MVNVFRIVLCCAALATHATHAAEPAKPQAASAADAGVRVPAATYDSAFNSYRPYREPKLAPWRELNDEVRQTGGHIGIFGGAAGKPPAQHPAGHKQ